MIHLTASLVVAAAAAGPPATPPPSGRPPAGPLLRVEPRVYDLSVRATVRLGIRPDGDRDVRSPVTDSPLVMPVIFQGTYSTVLADSLETTVGNGPRTMTRHRLASGFPFATQLIVAESPVIRHGTLRLRFAYRAQVWSSRVAEEAAATVPWPQEWPDEVRDGLAPQHLVESDDELFVSAVEQATQGRLRLAPPYLAAKELTRYCIERMQVSGDGTVAAAPGALSGLEMVGARQAARSGTGSEHDLVCVCVAVLRAAGIPARPVVGVEAPDEREQARARERGREPAPELVSWVEFYLPDAGWVPFDPDAMRRRGIHSLDVRQPWPEFGTMKDLNQRIPLAYHFVPPAVVETPQRPSIWGWNGRPGWIPEIEQQLRVTVTSRGRGDGP